MKNLLKTFAAMLLATMAFTACQDLSSNPSPYSEYAHVKGNFDMANFVKTYTFSTNVNEPVVIKVATYFDTRVLKDVDSDGNENEKPRWKVENYGFSSNGTITLATQKVLSNVTYMGDNPYGNVPGYTDDKTDYNLTTDLELYVYEARKCSVEGVPGTFRYPIRIRQTGADGTYYVTKDQIKKWKTEPHAAMDEMVSGNRNYVKGTVTEVGPLTRITYKPGASGSWDAPWVYDGKNYNICDFDVMELTVNVDGETLPVRLEYVSNYKLFSNFNVKAGDTVEICFRIGGACRERGIYIATPLDVFVK